MLTAIVAKKAAQNGGESSDSSSKAKDKGASKQRKKQETAILEGLERVRENSSSTNGSGKNGKGSAGGKNGNGNGASRKDDFYRPGLTGSVADVLGTTQLEKIPKPKTFDLSSRCGGVFELAACKVQSGSCVFSCLASSSHSADHVRLALLCWGRIFRTGRRMGLTITHRCAKRRAPVEVTPQELERAALRAQVRRSRRTCCKQAEGDAAWAAEPPHRTAAVVSRWCCRRYRCLSSSATAAPRTTPFSPRAAGAFCFTTHASSLLRWRLPPLPQRDFVYEKSLGLLQIELVKLCA